MHIRLASLLSPSLLLASLLCSLPAPLHAEEYEIRKVALSGDAKHSELTLEISGPVTYHSFSLERPPRLVVDIRGARLRADISSIPRGHPLIKGIRQGLRPDGTLRLVFDLKAPVKYRSSLHKPEEGTLYRLVVKLDQATTGTTQAAKQEAAKSRPSRTGLASLDGIAAVVNNQAITCFEVEQTADDMANQLRQSGLRQLPPRQQLLSRALETRIVNTLQLQEGERLELKVADEEVDKAIADIESSNNIPAGQLVQILKDRGIDIDVYRQTLSERLLFSKLINVAVRAKLQVSEESMREYFRKYLQEPKPLRQVHLQEIFLALPPEPTPEDVLASRQQAEELRRRAQGGEDFGQLATLHSDAPDAAQGGDMGWFFPGSMPPRFAPVLELPVGHISQPLHSPSGFHLLRVSEERWLEPPSREESFDEVHARHILITLPAAADDQTREKLRQRAEQIAEELKDVSDEEFATRAKEISQGPSAERGGDLGWFKRGQMVEAFEQVAFSLEPGQTSGVVESPFGLHIIRVIERRHVDPNSFEAQRDRIQEILLNAELQDQLPRWIASLKAKAIIVRKGC